MTVRWLAALLLLGGCEAAQQDEDGPSLPEALVLNPLCVIFCSTGVSAAASDSDITGSGSASNTQSQTQTRSVTGGS